MSQEPVLFVLVILSALQAWFPGSLTSTSKVGTVISFLQGEKLRHGVGGGLT